VVRFYADASRVIAMASFTGMLWLRLSLVLWQEIAGVANWRDMLQSARSGQVLEALVQVTAIHKDLLGSGRTFARAAPDRRLGM
jgi:hypothetical protein